MPEKEQTPREEGTRERVGAAVAAISDRARQSPGGVAAGDTGHGVDANMDRIASQAGMGTDSTSGEVRQSLEGHRRELQLATIARSAQRAQQTVDLPEEKKQVVRGNSGTQVSVVGRDQRSGGAGGASVLDQGSKVSHNQTHVPKASVGRTERVAITAPSVAVKRDYPERQRPVVAGGHSDVPMPPPRPQTGAPDVPGMEREPERPKAPAAPSR